MKQKHGERINLHYESCDGFEPEYVKGHVTEDEAREALEAWEHGLGQGDLKLRHIFGRWVFPTSDEYDRELRTYDAPQRGAFKLTEVRHNTGIKGRRPDAPINDVDAPASP